MATAVLWADLDRNQTHTICHVQPWTYESVSRLLTEYLGEDGNTPQGEILMRLYFLNLRFAVENRYTAEKTSTVFSVLKLVHFTSMERCLSAEQSVEELRRLLLLHAVERPPYSLGIFSTDDVRKIVDHATDSYYRHYKLYRHCFTKKQLLDFSIKPDTVEVPCAVKPLQEATPNADVRKPDIEQAVEEEPKPLTEEEVAAEEEKEDEDLLNDPKTEMVQKLVAKRLESVKERVENEFKEQEDSYKARIAELEAKLAARSE